MVLATAARIKQAVIREGVWHGVPWRHSWGQGVCQASCRIHRTHMRCHIRGLLAGRLGSSRSVRAGERTAASTWGRHSCLPLLLFSIWPWRQSVDLAGWKACPTAFSAVSCGPIALVLRQDAAATGRCRNRGLHAGRLGSSRSVRTGGEGAGASRADCGRRRAGLWCVWGSTAGLYRGW